MKTNRWKIFTVFAAALIMVFACCFTACRSDNDEVSFNVSASYSAETGTVFTFPAVIATRGGQRESATVSVKDAGGNSVNVFGNAFFVSGTENYTAFFSAFGTSISRIVYVSANESPAIWVKTNYEIPAQQGREYIFNANKVEVTDGTTVQYAVFDDNGDSLASRVDENGNFRFIPVGGNNYLQIVASKNGKVISETLTVTGVDRSDNVIADFEYDEDITAVKNGPSGYTISYEISSAYAHGGQRSLRLNNLSGGSYPRILLNPKGNITLNADTAYKLVFWYMFDNPEGLPVGLAYNGAETANIAETGASTTKDGQWHKVELEVMGSQVASIGIYMFNWQGNTGVAPDASIDLYIDDIYLEPQIDGTSVYFAEQTAGETFDVSQFTAPLLLGGHEVPVGEYRVTKQVGSTVTEEVLLSNEIPLDETATWRLYPVGVTGDTAYVLRVVEELQEGVVPYAPCDIAEDVQSFDLGNAFTFSQTHGLYRAYDAAVNPFTLTFKADTAYDFTEGGRVCFDLTNGSTGANNYTVTVEATLADGTAVVVSDEEGNEGTFALSSGGSVIHSLHFDLPAGSSLPGTKLTFRLTCTNDSSASQYGNVIVRNFSITGRN